MQKCGSCLIITVSSIIRTGSKNGVLGGNKHNFITIIWGASPLPISHPLAHLPSSPIGRDRAAAVAALIKEMPPIGRADVVI